MGRSPAARPSILVVALALLLFAGCTGVPSADVTTSEPTTTGSPTEPAHTVTTTMPDSLDSTLAGLVTAENRTAYADTHNLDYDDGRVEVVIELAPGADLPDGYDIDVTARHEERVQARVSVDELVPLAKEGEVRFVRPPRTPEPDDPGTVNADG